MKRTLFRRTLLPCALSVLAWLTILFHTHAQAASPEIAVQQPPGTDLVDGTATIGFGNQNLFSTSAAKTFTILNTGTANLTGLAITKDGSHPGDFTVGALGATTLTPAASTTFTVTFRPGTVGARGAAIHIASNDSDENPFDITLTGFGAGTIYAANYGDNKVEKFGATTGADLGAFATGVSGPLGIAFDSAGNLYTANNNNHTITKFTAAGVSSVFASSGLNFPGALIFDSAGNLYAANKGNNTVRRFSPTGTDLGTFASAGLNVPHAFAFDKNGNLYVANATGNTVRKFSPTGVDLGNFTSTGLNNAHGLAFDTAGNLYVANSGSHTIRKFSSTGTDLGVFANVNAPTGLIFDSAGNLYAASPDDNTIRKLSPTGADLGTFATGGASAGNSLYQIAFGPPVPEISVSANSVNIADGDSTPSTADHTDFGSVVISGGTVTRTFTITNAGDDNLTLGTLNLSGPHAADFTVAIAATSPVTPGNLTTFQITFNPNALGLRSATVSFSNNDGNENPFDFALTGNGVNTPPVAPPQTFIRALNLTLKIRIADVLAACSDSDGGTPALTSVGASVQGATISITATHLFYSLAANAGDSFPYMISDGQGGTTTGTITVAVVNPGGLVQSITPGVGSITVNSAGIPSFAYDILRATNPGGPWATIDTQSAPASGLFSYTDASPPLPMAFYRLMQHVAP